MKGWLRTGLMVVVLVGVGFLAGSFWLEWRRTEMGDPGSPETVAGSPVAVPEGWESRVRVEVLNGMGEPGAARRAAERLRGMGFDVVFYGNAESFDHARTRVLDRSGRAGAAERLADSLRVDSVVSRPAPQLYLDGTVVLGEDWGRVAARIDSARRAGAEGPSLGRLLDWLSP